MRVLDCVWDIFAVGFPQHGKRVCILFPRYGNFVYFIVFFQHLLSDKWFSLNVVLSSNYFKENGMGDWGLDSLNSLSFWVTDMGIPR